MDSYPLKRQLVGELKEVLRIKQLNLELLDALESTIIFLLSESTKNKRVFPNARRLDSLIKRVRVLYDELYPPTKNQQPFSTPDKKTKPKIVEKERIKCKILH